MTEGSAQSDQETVLATQALMRAAKRARELAARTGTEYVVMRDGKLVREIPKLEEEDQKSRLTGEN